MKRVYHIVFKEKESDHMSKGKNYTSKTIESAIMCFYVDYPGAVFIAMHDVNALADIRGTAHTEVKQKLDDFGEDDLPF